MEGKERGDQGQQFYQTKSDHLQFNKLLINFGFVGNLGGHLEHPTYGFGLQEAF
jgi:hypothetical protein